MNKYSKINLLLLFSYSLQATVLDNHQTEAITPVIAKIPNFDEQQISAKLLKNTLDEQDQLHTLTLRQTQRQQKAQDQQLQQQLHRAKNLYELTKIEFNLLDLKEKNKILKQGLNTKKLKQQQLSWLQTLHISAIIPLSTTEYKAILYTKKGKEIGLINKILSENFIIKKITSEGVLFSYDNELYPIYME